MTDDFTLGDFVTEAELTGKSLTSQRGSIRILDRTELTKEAYDALHRTPEQLAAESILRDRLTIPPPSLARGHSSRWRRLSNGAAASPSWKRRTALLSLPSGRTRRFGKAVERSRRSQVAVYIVDAADPLAFFCADLVREMLQRSIPVFLGLRKADLVPGLCVLNGRAFSYVVKSFALT
jgi:hypothetical protein